MKKIEAIWEIENIGSNTLEFVVEKGDKCDISVFENISKEYDYIVVKVPTNMTDFNWALGKLGFTMIETQLMLSKDIKDLDLNDRYIRRLLPKVTYRVVETEEEINNLLDRITPSMFITDRIALDSNYGSEIGCRRYKNYIKNSFLKHSLEIIGVYFNNSLVGFDMHHIEEKFCYGKLGGIFSDVKIPGLGFLTCCAPLLFANEKYGVTTFYPEISTNNLPVLNLYDYFHFNIMKITYVFVKHNK